MDRKALGDRVPHGGVSDPTILDFSVNVNPRRPDGVAGVYAAALAQARRYPDDTYESFRLRAAKYVDCSMADVIPTPGGLGGLRLVIDVLVDPGDRVAVPAPTFGEYERELALRRATVDHIPAADLPDIDPAAFRMVLLCNPNNPTGRLVTGAELARLVERCQMAETPLLVDEAFLGFTTAPSLAGTPGTVVVRSLTKLFGLPGLRAGFVVTPGVRGDLINRARRPWNLGTPAAEVGTYCMGQTAFIDATREQVATERARLEHELAARFDVCRDSAAPFLLVAVRDESVSAVLAELSAADLAARDATTFRGLDRHIRIAVRRPEENDRLLEVLVG